jgi:hypothetical protein
MKKVLFVLIFLGLVAAAFAVEETWLSLGTGLDVAYEQGSVGGTDFKRFDMRAPTINLNLYQFWNRRNIGLFATASYMFYSTNDSTPTGDTKTTLTDFGLLLGPGFRWTLNNDVKFYAGVGLGVNSASQKQDSTSQNDLRLGIGCDLGVKWDLYTMNDIGYVSLGAVTTFNVMDQKKSGGDTKMIALWDGLYFMAEVRPYIAMGFNYFRSSAPGDWGIPK